MNRCDCTCKYFVSGHMDARIDFKEHVVYIPLCTKFTLGIAIIKCEHYEMK